MTWQSMGSTMTGVLDIPDGSGPFPVVVVNHGYVPESQYYVGQGSSKYADPMASAGFVTVSPNYPGYAGSGPAPPELPSIVGQAIADMDLITALATLLQADTHRVAVAGHSNGGGVALILLASDDRVRAVALYAPVSSNMIDNARRLWADPNATGDLPSSAPTVSRSTGFARPSAPESAFQRHVEHRLHVDDRRSVDRLEVAHVDAQPVDGEDRDAMQPDGIGTIRRARAEDTGLGIARVVARDRAKRGTIRAIEPCEQDDLVARVQVGETLRNGFVEDEPGVGRALVALSRGVGAGEERRFDAPDRPELEGALARHAEATFQRYPSGSLKWPEYPPHCAFSAGLTMVAPALSAFCITSSTCSADPTM